MNEIRPSEEDLPPADKTQIEIDQQTHEKLLLWRAKESGRSRRLEGWDEFFLHLYDKNNRWQEVKEWSGTIAIFFGITATS